MGNYDTGMKLSAKGLSITGEQVVKLESGKKREEIFVLNGGTLSSYVYDPLSDTGFTPTTTGSAILNDAKQYVLPTSVLVEIAGGDGIKLRFDNGGLITSKVLPSGVPHSELTATNVARVTKNDYYVIPDGKTITTPIPYYKSGADASPLVPMLAKSAETVSDIIAVFEGKNGDKIVRLADAYGVSEAIIGYVGTHSIVSNGTTTNIVLSPTNKVPITGFGTITRNAGKIDTIKKSKQVPTNSPTKVDYSAEFSPSHYDYIQRHRQDYRSLWAGVGNTGYVVDMGDAVHMEVLNTGVSSVVGEPIRVSTPTVQDETNFIVDANGIFQEVLSGGTLAPLKTVDKDGVMLINYLHENDMSQQLIVTNGLLETEPFAVNGYCFGYGSGRWVDANLTAL